jgi:hypothetical protein
MTTLQRLRCHPLVHHAHTGRVSISDESGAAVTLRTTVRRWDQSPAWWYPPPSPSPSREPDQSRTQRPLSSRQQEDKCQPNAAMLIG